MQKLFLLLLLLFLFLAGITQVKSIYVSPSGNDQHTGSIHSPLRTIEKALTQANTSPGKPVVIFMRQGRYYLEKTIRLNPENVLPSALTITAYEKEQVVISAGKRLYPDWKPYRDGIYKAILPAGISFERLYVNDELQVLARYPNFDSSARVFHGTAEDAISPERVLRWKNPEGGYVHALHQGEWGGFHYRITGVDKKGNLQLEGGWQNNRPAPMSKEFRFVENIFEELDTPGEWFLDKEKHTLYYYPRKPVQLQTAVVEVSQLKNSIELLGTVAAPVKNIEFRNLHFEHNERSFMETREPLLRSDWTIYRGGALLLDGTENCRITSCHFTGLGGNAIMFSNYNYKDTVSYCLVTGIGANAVCFIGDPKAVRSPLFSYEKSIPYDQLDKTPGPLTHNYPQYCLVNDNLFYNLGEIEKQATGVEIEMAAFITVTHNSIYNTPRAGINIGDGCWGGHELAYNDVFNTVRETGDHGSFNSWGRDRYWNADREYMDSIVQVHPELILLDAQRTNLIHDNRFRCDHGWDIDLDDGSTNYHIYNNLCLNGGLKLREGFYRTVENNVLVNNSFHPHVWFKNSGDIFEHNIISRKYFPIGIRDWGTKIDFNLFPDSLSLQTARNNGTDKDSRTGDPLFINPRAGNYAVREHSPALTIGFQNFAMDQFGVQNPELKSLALQPEMFLGMPDDGMPGSPDIISFLGGRIKSVDGPGERSAYGVPVESGVIVIAAGSQSLLSKSGIQDKDVLVTADGQPVMDIKGLVDICQSANWKGKIPVEVYRNQQKLKLTLMLK